MNTNTNTNTNTKENCTKKVEKPKNDNRIKYGPIKNAKNKKPFSKNNSKNIKAKTEHFKNVSNSDFLSHSIKDIINNIQNNNRLLERISYLQLWWKTIFQIIKIQKYLRGFLYRIKLLKLLELKEKIVYGIIQLSKAMKIILYKKLTSIMKNKLFKQKYYFNKWNNLITKKNILQKLKKNKVKKKEKNKETKKMKSESVTKRELPKIRKKEEPLPERMSTIDKSSKKLGLSPTKKISDDISLSSKKNGLETSRINTEKNIRKIFGTKNNSMERKRTKKSENNMTNITSNKTLKHQRSNKKQCQFYKTSSNFLNNKSHNQIKKNKLSKNNLKNVSNISKKNTNIQKYKKVNRNRNKKIKSDDLGDGLNKYKSYNIESTRKKIGNSAKKNSQLEYISKHENRFHCPKEIYYLNKNKKKYQNQALKIEKLDTSGIKNYERNGDTIKNDDNISNSHIRAKSLENRPKKKYKSFIQNMVNIKKISNDDSCLKSSNINRIKDDISLNKNENAIKPSLSIDEQKKIVKSKTKILKKGKRKRNKKSSGLKDSSKVKNKKKSILVLIYFKLWKTKNTNKKIINKLRAISIISNSIEKLIYKNSLNIFIKSLQKIKKYKILSYYFNIYRNIIFKKIILQKLKEYIKTNIKKIKNNKIENNTNINNNNNNKDNSKNNNIINSKNNNKDKNNIVNLIEISPYTNTKVDSKIKNNFIKNEINKKLLKLLKIKQKLIEYHIKRKHILKWKLLTYQYEPNLKTGIQNFKNFYNKHKNDKDDNDRINSSYHKKRVKYHKNFNLEFSFDGDNNKLYNKKIVYYNNNNNNISTNKEDYFNKSQPEINNFNNFEGISINKDDIFNNTHSLINNFNNFNNYNNYNNYNNNYNSAQKRYKYPNLNTSAPYEEPNNINININLITKSPLQKGVYQKKKIINYKNNNINKNTDNSAILRDLDKSNYELNHTADNNTNNNDFLNNSMIMRRKNNMNNIYYPKHVSPNLIDNESDYETQKYFMNEQPEFPHKKNIGDNSMAYKKINIRYQKMYYDNDLNSEHRHINFGILEEQTNEGTN